MNKVLIGARFKDGKALMLEDVVMYSTQPKVKGVEGPKVYFLNFTFVENNRLINEKFIVNGVEYHIVNYDSKLNEYKAVGEKVIKTNK